MQLKPVTGDHIHRFISLFTDSPTEQDKTQQTATLVETAHASFTGRPLSLPRCVKCCFLYEYSVLEEMLT